MQLHKRILYDLERSDYMLDMTMCSSENCPERNRCYRSRATPDRLQSYSNYEYTCNENSGFESFLNIESDNNIKR